MGITGFGSYIETGSATIELGWANTLPPELLNQVMLELYFFFYVQKFVCYMSCRSVGEIMCTVILQILNVTH